MGSYIDVLYIFVLFNCSLLSLLTICTYIDITDCVSQQQNMYLYSKPVLVCVFYQTSRKHCFRLGSKRQLHLGSDTHNLCFGSILLTYWYQRIKVYKHLVLRWGSETR